MRWSLAKPPVPLPLAIRRTGDDTPANSVWRFVWRMSGHRQVWLSLLAVAVAGLSMAPLELQRRIVNDAVEGADVENLVTLGAIYLLVLVLLAGTKLIFGIYQSWLSESAIQYVRGHLARLHLKRVGDDDSQDDAAAEDASRAIPIINTEVEEVGGFVGEGISGPLVHFGTFAAILGYMLVTEPLLATIAAIFLLPQVLVMPLLQRLINRLVAARVELQRDLAGLVSRIAPGAEDMPSERAVRGRIRAVYTNRMRIAVLKFLGKAGINVLNGLAPLAALVVGGYFVIEGQATLGVVVAFVTGFDRLADPLRQLIAYYRLYARVRVQHQKIAEWMA